MSTEYTVETLPSWVAVGEMAAVYNSGRGRAEEATAKIVTIEKVGKVHIETTGGKFRVKTLESTTRAASFSSTDQLLAVDNPKVLDAQRRKIAGRVAMQMFSAIDANRMNSNDPAVLLSQVTAIRDAAIKATTKLQQLVAEAAAER